MKKQQEINKTRLSRNNLHNVMIMKTTLSLYLRMERRQKQTFDVLEGSTQYYKDVNFMQIYLLI